MPSISRRRFIERAAMGAAAAGVAAWRGTTVRADPLGLPIGCQTYPERQRIADGKFVELLKDLNADKVDGRIVDQTRRLLAELSPATKRTTARR